MKEKSMQKVFLSYSWHDKDKVEVLRHELINSGIQVVSDSEVAPGANWEEEIKYRMESSDFVMAIISPALFEKEGFKFDYTDEFIESARSRNINLIPVVIEKTNLPPYLLEFEIFDLTTDGRNSLYDLVNRIKAINNIAFDNFTGEKFEDLVYEILVKSEFKNIKREQHSFNSEIDFIAEYYSKDPFGTNKRETWIVESKFYKEARFDIKTINSIIDHYKYIPHGYAKLLLITNSQFTSVVRQHLENIQQSNLIEVKTIDGLQLKNIIAREPEIFNKYFNS